LRKQKAKIAKIFAMSACCALLLFGNLLCSHPFLAISLNHSWSVNIPQGDQGRRTLTPSNSSESLHGNGVSKAPRRLPATINKELEKRKIGSRSYTHFFTIFNIFLYWNNISYSLTNINIADSIRDKSQRRERNGRKGSGGSEASTDEFFSSAGRRKPGHLRDSLASAEKYARYVKCALQLHQCIVTMEKLLIFCLLLV
jgi:hypothetical protein